MTTTETKTKIATQTPLSEADQRAAILLEASRVSFAAGDEHGGDILLTELGRLQRAAQKTDGTKA